MSNFSEQFESFRHEPHLNDFGFDFDGTMANHAQAPDYKLQEAFDGAIETIMEVKSYGLNPIIWTSRHWSDSPALKEWCKYYNLDMGVIAGKKLWWRSVDDRHYEFNPNNDPREEYAILREKIKRDLRKEGRL